MGTVNENITIRDIIRELLLAITESQSEVNKAFVGEIEKLASTNVLIKYKKNSQNKEENKEISGNALNFGILPVLLQIQKSTIELKTALSISKNSNLVNKTINQYPTKVRFKTDSVDAKYQNTYSFKPEYASVIKITVVPTPPENSILNNNKK